MKIQVQEVPPEGLRLSYELGPKDWDLEGKGYALLEPVQIVLNVLKHGEGEVYLSGTLSARVQGECGRCTESFGFPILSNFHLDYIPSPKKFPAGEVALSPDGLDLNFYEGDEIDIDHEIMGQCLLAIPMHALCQPDCRGLCPQCGVDLNKGNCQCHSEPVDLRWAALEKFKYKENNAKSKT